MFPLPSWEQFPVAPCSPGNVVKLLHSETAVSMFVSKTPAYLSKECILFVSQFIEFTCVNIFSCGTTKNEVLCGIITV